MSETPTILFFSIDGELQRMSEEDFFHYIKKYPTIRGDLSFSSCENPEHPLPSIGYNSKIYKRFYVQIDMTRFNPQLFLLEAYIRKKRLNWIFANVQIYIGDNDKWDFSFDFCDFVQNQALPYYKQFVTDPEQLASIPQTASQASAIACRNNKNNNNRTTIMIEEMDEETNTEETSLSLSHSHHTF